MYRFRAHWGVIVGTALTMLCLAGCTENGLPSDLSGLTTQTDAAQAWSAGQTGTTSPAGQNEQSTAANRPTDPAAPGAPADPAASDATTASDQASAKDDAVMSALRAPVEPDPTAPDEQPVDEPVNFAEDPALYTAVSAEVVAFPEDAILSDVTTGGGGPPVEHGRLAGRFWNNVPNSDSDHSGGIFRGHWVAADGQPRGVLRGEYRPLPPDKLPPGIAGGGVFHGKFIDAQGHFRGTLRGRYGHKAGEPGFFFGRWHDRHDRLIGVAEGQWHDEPGTNGGRFAGRWAAFNLCDEVNTLPEVQFEPGDFGGFDTKDETVDVASADTDPTSIGGESDVVAAGGPPCIDPNDPHGFVRGWHRPRDGQPDDDPAGGVFRGHWRTASGDVAGVLRGRYVPLPPGAGAGAGPDGGGQVLGKFYGKYVSRSGKFRGFVRGVYGTSAHGLGVFRGHYYDRNQEEQGHLLGRWDDAPNRPGGPFFGVWWGNDLDATP